ncbi:hypothetical protein FF1_032199 [Malus domestica]
MDLDVVVGESSGGGKGLQSLRWLPESPAAEVRACKVPWETLKLLSLRRSKQQSRSDVTSDDVKLFLTLLEADAGTPLPPCAPWCPWHERAPALLPSEKL